MSVPTITISEKPQDMEIQKPKADQEALIEKLEAENKELRAILASYDEKFRSLERDKSNEFAFLRGRIEGLEFSIRCNGISGKEVTKA